ncbi:MAG TPA: type III-B CRISPR module-associated protein Cmr5 [Thermoanaerobaculia bacterium]|nr:type III-B CRISPR module-associated protein Cmr5 [Thermoanaerobaculia bacterium]
MTLEQQRAALAFKHVQGIPSDQKDKDLYGSMAQKLPVLIRTAGLCQAVHFVRSRKKEVLDTLLNHVAEQLRRVDTGITDGTSLCERVRNAELSQYLWLTREALASAEWYSRLSQSELGVDRATDADK